MKSILWLIFWNLGLIVLSICVLAGCRSTAEKNYALVQWPRSTIGLIWGEECEEATADIIPDWYKFGASGVCRVTDGETSCKRKFPPTFNLAQAVIQDLDAADSSSTLEKCKEAIDKPIDHKTPKTLGAVLVAFLITSIFINLFSVAIAAAEGHAWALWTSGILAVDMLLIFGSLILTVAMMNYEGGGYLTGVHASEFSDREMMGIALWMLLAMLIGRLFSNPWLIILFVFILVTIIVVSLVLIRTRGFFYVVRTVVV
ncbi:uncharacterized protein FIESC28_01739 [Fusarium coffeatum]|uniref:Nadh oxidase n=1 Tax=Fusarium coffeatum TaxID=231269 RepID=A0A366S840_9HYPO|nr:uncharacterized protein FIESC28_01739 [Fusarium coffeatum]RBR25501.1 hypothetical protein FIESC28_01739 [Fusarium coffeatum]